MKRIALMTWYDNENYGTALQSFALQTVISQFAICEIIPYKSPHPGYGMKDILNPVLRKNFLWKLYERIILAHFSKQYLLLQEERRRRMTSFLSEYLRFAEYDSCYETLESLQNKYDIFICGSDQIWNPTRLDKHFYLDFVNPSNFKIAYAPSFGVSKISKKIINNDIKKLINQFDFLSVREHAGRTIIKQFSEKDVPVCLDPTLLMDSAFWKKLADKSQIKLPSDYVYCYLLGRNKKHLRKSQEAANKLHMKLLLQPNHLSDYTSEIELIPPSGPIDFLNSINQSRLVCTDSYHGVIFSIIFHKPFILYKRFASGAGSSQNSRIETLLQLFDLEERLDFDWENSREKMLEIPFEKYEAILKSEREKSIKYLKTAIDSCLRKKDGH